MQQDKYGQVAKFLHWSIATLIILNYIVGFTLDSTKWYTFHKQAGVTILLLVILRIIWRFTSAYPKQLSTLSTVEKSASVIVHWILYVLMFSIPVLGILLSQAHGYPVSFWDIFNLPTLIGKQPMDTAMIIDKLHIWSAHTIMILVGLHVLAAFKHYFINKDRVLQRMLPFSNRK